MTAPPAHPPGPDHPASPLAPTPLVRGPRIPSSLPRSPLALDTRRELGLPTDRPIIMSGHQADLWHCGILAKWFAAHHLASRHAAHASWIVVDHDTNDPTSIAYPARTPAGEQSMLARGRWQWGTDDGTLPTRLRPARAPAPPPDASRCWSPSIHASLVRVHAALTSTGTDLSLAAQLTIVAAQLLAPLDRSLPPDVIYTRRLAATPIFQALLRTMLKDPAACIEAYNTAAARFPTADIRPLELQPSRIELPIWSITRSRRPVFARDADCTTLDLGPAEALAPRALLLSAALRLAACDLFIHGTGGGEYDQVTDAWITRWLIESPRARAAADPALRDLLDERNGAMAPGLVVSATVRLPFADVAVPTPTEIDHAIWLAHSARHRILTGQPRSGPAAFDAARKQALVETIAAARRDPQGALRPRRDRQAARDAYRELHAQLATSREQHAPHLADLAHRAAAARAARSLSAIVHDRTWSFALHSQDALAALRDAVEAAL